MSEPVPVALQIRDSARAPTAATLEVQVLAPGARLQRLAFRLVVAWGLALFSLFIPLLHFVLVPGFLLAGPVLAWLAGRATVRVISTSVACPKCTGAAAIEPDTTGWPAAMRCLACGTTFSAVPSAAG
ncbi:MAG: hypothetical protein Q8L48_42725 [Archangium sp.]|nr:hypothetical protein [Archangium sp.]